MRHDPASAAVVIMLKCLKMHGMAQAVGDLAEQGSPAFEAAIPILRAETVSASKNECRRRRQQKSEGHVRQCGENFWMA